MESLRGSGRATNVFCLSRASSAVTPTAQRAFGGNEATYDFSAIEDHQKMYSRVLTNEDDDIEVPSAFVVLNDLASSGKVPGDVADTLKKHFRTMRTIARDGISREREALKKAKSMHNELLGERVRLERTRLGHENTLVAVEELEQAREKLAREFEEAEQQDTMLRYEVGELHHTSEDLKAQLEEIKAENSQLVVPELERLQAAVSKDAEHLAFIEAALARDRDRRDALMNRTGQIEKETAEMQQAFRTAEAKLTKLDIEPERIRKQGDAVAKAAGAMQHEVERLAARSAQQDDELVRLKTKRAEAEKLKKALDHKLELHKDTVVHRQRDVEAVSRNLQLEQARYHQHMTEKVELELKRRAVDEDTRRENDTLALLRKEHDSLRRKHRQKQHMANLAAAMVPALQQQRREAEAELVVRRALNKKLSAEEEELRADVDVGIVRYLRQEATGDAESARLAAVVAEVDTLEAEVAQWGVEQRKQDKLCNLLAAQRELKAAEARRAQQAVREAREQTKVKALVIADLAKRWHDGNNRLKEFGALYDVVKGERNKYVNLIQASNQALAEMREKIKILQNEVDILRNESTAKGKALQREAAAHQAAQLQRDALRLDSNKASKRSDAEKAAAEYRRKQEEVERQIGEVEKLNAVINGLERAVLQLRGRYESAVAQRNAAGLALVDRNDELCILYEKANLQETTLKQGELAMHKREEDLRALRRHEAELARRLELARRRMPGVPAGAEKVVQLQQELAQERAVAERLCTDLQDPTNLGRWRALEGDDPDAAELQEKIQILEARLSDKREQLLEKELVLEELSALTSKLRAEADASKEDSLRICQQVNDMQNQIRETTRRMMAVVSELSMYQATAMRLQQEKSLREQELEQQRVRAARGEAPSEAAERELQRRIAAADAAADAAAAAVSAAAAGLRGGVGMGSDKDGKDAADPDAVRTRAEQRPNAYISDDLGIPRPYGALAPFKPQEAGATMRHIRPPEPREIVI